MARLIFKFKEKVLEIVPLSATQGVTIGRHHTNIVTIDNLAVSGFHARIDLNDDGVLLTDLKSKNGTFVNGVRIEEGMLRHEDTIMVGKHTLVLDLHEDIEVQADAEAAAALQGAPPAMSDSRTMSYDTIDSRHLEADETALPDADLVYADRDNLTLLAGGEGEIALGQRPVTIGSNKDADITVSGFWGLLVGAPAVTISKQASDYVLHYTGGLIKPKRNGTSVKGTIKLNHEDVLDVGPVRVQVQLRKP